MQLYFIRHGQSNNNAIYEQTGSYAGGSEDPELTELGSRQAERLAEFLNHPNSDDESPGEDPQNLHGFGLTHLYTSLMVRAVATANIMSRILSLPMVAWSDIHEGGGIHFDDPKTGKAIGLPGKNRAYFEAHFPHLVLPDSLGEQGWWNRPYELRAERRTRAHHFLQEVIQLHGDTNHHVAVISHGGFYNHFMAALLGLEDELRGSSQQVPDESADENIILGKTGCIWFYMNNCAITRVDFKEDHVDIMYQNRVDFLPWDLVS